MDVYFGLFPTKKIDVYIKYVYIYIYIWKCTAILCMYIYIYVYIYMCIVLFSFMMMGNIRTSRMASDTPTIFDSIT